MVKDTKPKSWKGLVVPPWVKASFRTPNSLLKADKYGRSWQSVCDREVLDGMSEYFCT